MKSSINTEKAPAAIGPYSQAIEWNNMMFLSGQLPIDPTTGEFYASDIKRQTEQALKNINEILKANGYQMTDVIKTTVFLSDMELFSEMNEVYSTKFQKPFPARSAVAVKTLPKGALVEIEAIAAK